MTTIFERIKAEAARLLEAQRIYCPECKTLVYDAGGTGYEDHPVSLWGDDLHEVWCSECDTSFQVRESVTRTYEMVPPTT